MSRRRLDKLEGSLSPMEAVLHWLAEAHAFGTLPDYVESLVDQPEAVHPFVALPARVEQAVWTSMRRKRPGFVREVTREAIGDTIFLLRLVIGLNVHIEETLQLERLRHTALYWSSRALNPERRTKGDPRGRGSQDWARGIAASQGVLLGTERSRASSEARYLGGQDSLFPELASAWRDLLAAAEYLHHGSSPDEDIVSVAEQRVQRVALMARADGLEASGRWAAAENMAARVVRLADGGSGG